MLSNVPEAITFQAVVTAVSFAAALALITAIILAAVESRFKGYFGSLLTIFGVLLLFGVPISIVAYVSGLLTTASRTTGVANVIPAVLALIGGLNIYVFGSDNRYKLLVAYSVSLFAIMLFYGAEYGAYRREADRVLRLGELSRQELVIRHIRKNLDLPEEIPSWLTSSEPK
jgi:hypothetical protein